MHRRLVSATLLIVTAIVVASSFSERPSVAHGAQGTNLTPLVPVTVDVDVNIKFQPLHGVGAALTSSSAYLLMKQLTPQQRQPILRRLFGGSSSTEGINGDSDDEAFGGLTMVRLPMGASDFNVIERYSYDDLPANVTEDWDMKYFSIDKDLEFIVPAIQEILRMQPHLKFIAAPWSAPGWMKTSGVLYGGALRDDDPRIISSYATYFLKFIDAYAAHGVHVTYLSLQNEPQYSTGSYPTMTVTPSQEVALAEAIMALLLTSSSSPSSRRVTPKIVIYDHNWNNATYPMDVLGASPTISSPTSLVAGTAFHCYEGGVSNQTVVHDFMPWKEIMFTECTGGAWSPNATSSFLWDVSTLTIGAVRNWATVVLKWNVVLNPSGGPKLDGGCGDCRGVVTVDTGNTTTTTTTMEGRGDGTLETTNDNAEVVSPFVVTWNEDFYALAHLGMATGRWNRAAPGEPGNTMCRGHSSSTAPGLTSLLVTPCNNTGGWSGERSAWSNFFHALLLANSNAYALNVSVLIAAAPPASSCTAHLALPSSSVATLRWPNDGPPEAIRFWLSEPSAPGNNSYWKRQTSVVRC